MGLPNAYRIGSAKVVINFIQPNIIRTFLFIFSKLQILISQNSTNNDLVQLNLPEIDLKLEKRGDAIFVLDVLRKKKLLLTPEEWVRQHFLGYLMKHLKYPTGLIACEQGLKYDKQNKRTDIVVNTPQGEVLILVECKAPHVAITEATLNQIALYNRKLNPKYLVLKNGIQHYFFQILQDTLIQADELPVYQNPL